MFADRFSLRLFVGLSVFFLAGAFVASDGYLLVDELIYYGGADAFAFRGSLTIDNGFERFGSEDLRLWFMKAGPGGLTPQYPPGTAILAAPFVALLEQRGLMLMNALAAIGTLFCTWFIARAVSGRVEVARTALVFVGLGTFLAEYALGLWPHALGTFFVMAAVAFSFPAMEARPLRPAILSGLMVGLGLLFRIDTVLILPAIGLAALLFASRPVLMIVGGAIGLVPGVAFLSWINWLKFGSPNPLSYGGGGGATNIGSHLTAIGLMALALLALLLVRQIRWTPKRTGIVLGLLGAAVLVAFVIDPTRKSLLRILRGYYILLFDLRLAPAYSTGIMEVHPGVVAFWGTAKKALALSLPWLGALLFLIRWRSVPVRPRWLVYFGAAIVIWTLPFAMHTWHGGLSSNMRYFLPVVPLLAILVAGIWTSLSDRFPLEIKFAFLAAMAGCLTVMLWRTLAPSGFGGAQQIFPAYPLIVTAMLSALAMLRSDSSAAGRAAQASIAYSVGVAFILTYFFDLSFSETRREQTREGAVIAAQIEPPVLLMAPPEMVQRDFSDPGRLVSYRDWGARRIDTDLLGDALDAGIAVYLLDYDAGPLLEAHPEFERTGAAIDTDLVRLEQIVRAKPD